LMVGHFGLEGMREVGCQSGERRCGSASITGKGERLGRAAEGRADGARPAGQRGSGPRGEKEAGPGRWRFGPAGRPGPRERGRWHAAGTGIRRQPK
jgi:hypothetical protein